MTEPKTCPQSGKPCTLGCEPGCAIQTMPPTLDTQIHEGTEPPEGRHALYKIAFIPGDAPDRWLITINDEPQYPSIEGAKNAETIGRWLLHWLAFNARRAYEEAVALMKDQPSADPESKIES